MSITYSDIGDGRGVPASHRIVTGPDSRDLDADFALALGLPHLLERLTDIIDGLDERIALLAKRADLAGLPQADGLSDADAARYLALYSLLPAALLAERGRSGGEAGQSGGEAHAA